MNTLEIYNTLINYTLPFAVEQSDLDQEDLHDYIHDFYIDLQDNRVLFENGNRTGSYDLERLDKMQITKFFFQYVVRAKYIEGQWIDRRLIGRRTQQEVKLGINLAPDHEPKETSYEMYLKHDFMLFLESLDDVEKVILDQLLNRDTIESAKKAAGVKSNKYYKTLKTLKAKARRYL